jgi:hypothetical protein
MARCHIGKTARVVETLNHRLIYNSAAAATDRAVVFNIWLHPVDT